MGEPWVPPCPLLWVMPAEGAYLIDEKTPSWGIEPVPERLQVLGLLDMMLLWGNLSVSLLVISTAAAALSKKAFGFEGRWLWALLFGFVAVALALLGPIGFVRRYVRKFAVWAVLASFIYLTWWVFDKSNLHAFWHARGQG